MNLDSIKISATFTTKNSTESRVISTSEYTNIICQASLQEFGEYGKCKITKAYNHRFASKLPVKIKSELGTIEFNYSQRTKETYYERELSKINQFNEYAPTIKLTDANGDSTKNINISPDSANDIINAIKRICQQAQSI